MRHARFLAITAAFAFVCGGLIAKSAYNDDQERALMQAMLDKGFDPITAECALRPPYAEQIAKSAMCITAASKLGTRGEAAAVTETIAGQRS